MLFPLDKRRQRAVRTCRLAVELLEDRTMLDSATATVITSDSPDPSLVGQPVTVAFSVSRVDGLLPAPAGTVAVTDGTGASCTGTLQQGTTATSTGSCVLTPTTGGKKTLRATYSSTNDLGTSSDTESHRVTTLPKPAAYRTSGNLWFVRNTLNGGAAEVSFTYGIAGDIPVMGDWNGDGIATPGVFREGKFFLRNSLSGGFADIAFSFGMSGDTPVVGDWDGDGKDTIGIRRGDKWYLRNANSAGNADHVFIFGLTGDTPIIGDWNGDGIDTIGIRRGDHWFLKNANSAGYADANFAYALASDRPVIGDWNGDGVDTIGVYRQGSWYLRNSNSAGYHNLFFQFGAADDIALVARGL